MELRYGITPLQLLISIKNQLRSTSFDNHVIIVEYFETWEIYFVAGTVNH